LTYDCIIVGGGPAGLSAALVLGRARRRVLVCDSGHPRNGASQAVHGFLTRDGIPPRELLAVAREQLEPYGVEYLKKTVMDARCVGQHFTVTLEDDRVMTSTTLLLATGVEDKLPRVPGFDQFYGRSIFHCPYCDGWEVRDRPLAVYAKGSAGVALSLALETWSRDIVLCTDGRSRIARADRERLERHGIAIKEHEIIALEGTGGQLERIVFRGIEPMPRHAMFFSMGQQQRSTLPARLGCEFTKKGAVKTNRLEASGPRGLYVVGDASEDVQLVVIAAAEGAKAAFAINKLLQESETQ
jgi:thioredoxin reductase